MSAKDMPQSESDRIDLRLQVESFAAERGLVPPLSMEELGEHVAVLLEQKKLPLEHRDYIMVLLNNAVWAETVAAIPYDRRILLLPQCLSARAVCPAQMDEFGLLCEECGACPIGAMQALAEGLGYVVLVAEGTTVVTKLLESGKVDAVVGVSCLSALERSFPHMAADAIPGLAIPLHKAGCTSTEVDLEWLRKAIALKSAEGWSSRLDTQVLRGEVQSWFKPESLSQLIACGDNRTEQLAYDWLSHAGKFWRPLLLTCVYCSMSETEGVPDNIRKLAVAVECFHKASLIHDDIEDQDVERYGEPTLHVQHGVAVALNLGDFLLGEGYQLIAEAAPSPEMLARFIKIAADGHRMLCLGQGAELSGLQRDEPFSSSEIIEIFRGKTAPAFGVALRLGAVGAGADQICSNTLAEFSASLGVAYQVRDDLMEFQENNLLDWHRLKPSLLLALGYEAATQDDVDRFKRLWRQDDLNATDRTWLLKRFESGHVEEKAHQLLEHYKNEAVRSLNPLRHAPLKRLLRRVSSRMLGF